MTPSIERVRAPEHTGIERPGYFTGYVERRRTRSYAPRRDRSAPALAAILAAVFLVFGMAARQSWVEYCAAALAFIAVAP